MVTNISNLTRNGLADWAVQRLTAIVLLFYTPVIIGYFLFTPNINYESFSLFFGQFWVKIFTLITVISTFAHAWIGLWTVSTDYIKITFFRIAFQVFFVIALFVFTVWSIEVLWRL